MFKYIAYFENGNVSKLCQARYTLIQHLRQKIDTLDKNSILLIVSTKEEMLQVQFKIHAL